LVSSDGKTVAIGATSNDGANGADSGHVRVYEYTTSSGWAQLGQNIDGEATYDGSGYSVSLSADGKRVAVGAPDNDGNGFLSGHVRVYEYTTSSGWTQLGQDIDGAVEWDRSGTAVSLSADGKRVAVGAHGNDGNGDRSGHVRVYDYDTSSSTWEQLGLDIDGEAAFDQLGYSVSLSADGGIVAIGAPGALSNSGQVRVYELN
jgi:hypothetical protein